MIAIISFEIQCVVGFFLNYISPRTKGTLFSYQCHGIISILSPCDNYSCERESRGLFSAGVDFKYLCISGLVRLALLVKCGLTEAIVS